MRNVFKTILLASGCGLVAAPVSAQTIGMATLPPGAILNITAQVLSKVVQKKSKLKMRVLPFRGGAAVLAAVNAKRAEFGLTDIANMTGSTQGIAEFTGRPQKNLRVAMRLRPLRVGFFVRKSSSIKSIADIKGKRFPTRWSAFPNAITLANAILGTAGLSMKDVKGVPVTQIIRAANDFKAGKLDVGFFAIGAPKMAEVNSAVGGIRFISIANTPAARAAVSKVRPDYHLELVKPSPINAGILGPTYVLAVDTVVSVGTHVPNEVVEKFLEAVYSSKAELVKGHPLFRAFSPAIMGRRYSIAKHHPGAIAFYKKKGLWKAKK
jgi:uncharacterized protein